MAESSWPTVAGGRSITDVQWELMAPGFAASGVIASASDTAVVYGDSSGMQVKVRANKVALVSGNGWTSGTSEFTKTISANASGSTRIDLVVLRLTRSTRVVTVEVRAGTPGAGVPNPVQDSILAGIGVWELPIAQVTVISGASTIAASDVVNITPYLAAPQVVYVTTVAALDRILSPATGTLAYVAALSAGFPLYQYISGTGWRRMDWNNSWGIIGGTRYSGGGFFAYAYPTGFGDTGLRTGSVSLLAGRRYTFELSTPAGASATADVNAYLQFDIRKAGVAVGDAISDDQRPAWGTWLTQILFEYQPSADETVDFELWGKVVKTTGTTLNWAGFHRSSHTYLRVRDNGPASLITAG